MSNQLIQSIAQHLTRHEESKKFPYLDIKGNVTIGTGFKIDSEDEYAQLPLEINGRPATEAEKRADWQKMQAKKAAQRGSFNVDADRYSNVTSATLPPQENQARLQREIQKRIADIEKTVGAAAWAKLTDGQKTALVDVHYANGSLSDFPNLVKAAQTGNAQDLAREAHYFTDRTNKKRNYGRERTNYCNIVGLPDGSQACDTSFRSHFKQYAPNEQVPSLLTTQSLQPDSDNPANLDVKLAELDQPQEATASADIVTSQGAALAGADEAESQAPGVAAFLSAIRQPDDPVSEILLKDPKSWTAAEAKLVHASDAHHVAGHPDRDRAVRRTQAWYDHAYSTNPVERDATGRTIEPRIQPGVAQDPSPPKTADGLDLVDAVGRLGEGFARMAGKNNLAEVIKLTQMGLNLLGRTGQAGNQNRPDLKVDGDFGPKTRTDLKRQMADTGAASVARAVGLGAVEQAARNHSPEPTQTRASLDAAFEGLAGKTEPGLQSGWEKPVQSALNKLGQETFGPDDWTPLKEDGDFGPISNQAFGKLKQAHGPQGLAQGLGRMVGWLD